MAIAAETAVDPASVKIPNHPKSESVLRVLGQPSLPVRARAWCMLYRFACLAWLQHNGDLSTYILYAYSQARTSKSHAQAD